MVRTISSLIGWFKSIKRNLPCYDSVMKKMVKNLRRDIEAYIEENNVLDFKEIENHFGSAEDITLEFSSVINNSRIKAYKRKRATTTVAIFIAMILFAVFMILLGFIIIYIGLNHYNINEDIVNQTVFGILKGNQK